MKRPSRIKLSVIKPPAGLIFTEAIRGTGGIYVKRLTQALSTDSVVQIAKDDKYMLNMLRAAARKLKVKVLLAEQGEFLYFKPLAVEGEHKRLMLLLREPRTDVELQAKKLELHLPNTLADLAKDGLAHQIANGGNKGKWALTERGMDAL